MLAGVIAISKFFRARRMQRMLSHCSITGQTRILDVGGVPAFWDAIPCRPFIVLLNVVAPPAELGRAAHAIVGDGGYLPFADACFDLVVSNSAIEHVGDCAYQRRFAREVARVGRDYWVQTPNLWFPVEQHLFVPVIHWLPKAWQAPILRRFTLWSLIRVPDAHRRYFVAHYLRDIHLLDAAALSALFPYSRILRESILGMTKSLIAVRAERVAPTEKRNLPAPADF